MRLYEITQEIIDYTEMLANDEITQEEFNLAIEQLDAKDKYKSCYYALKEQRDDIASIDAEINRLNELKKKRQKKIDGYESYLIHNLEQTGGKVKTDLFEMKVKTTYRTVWKDELPEICYKKEVKETVKRKTIKEVQALIESGEVEENVFHKEPNKKLEVK